LQGRYPKPTTINPRTYGLPGLAYEAFQPPLYYYLAAPVSLLSGNYHTKAILLRCFGLLLLGASIVLLARLSKHVLKERWILGLIGGLVVFLMPGVVVRMVTISDLALAVPILILTLTELWIAWERKSSRRLILSGLLVGCSILTDLYLAELIPLFVLVAISTVRAQKSRAYRPAVVGGLLGGLVVSPWIVFNLVKYHSLTATALAKNEQLATVNPQHLHFTLGQLPGLTVVTLFQPVLPQEWYPRLFDHNLLSYGDTLISVLVVPVALVLAIALGRRLLKSGLWLLVLPFLCNILLCWYIDVGQQWESGSMLARYVYPTLAPLALLSVAAVVLLTSNYRPLIATVTVSSLFLVALWIHLVPSISNTHA
jgi:hypothetical protein